jgi:hypothetical protein
VDGVKPHETSAPSTTRWITTHAFVPSIAIDGRWVARGLELLRRGHSGRREALDGDNVRRGVGLDGRQQLAGGQCGRRGIRRVRERVPLRLRPRPAGQRGIDGMGAREVTLPFVDTRMPGTSVPQRASEPLVNNVA